MGLREGSWHRCSELHQVEGRKWPPRMPFLKVRNFSVSVGTGSILWKPAGRAAAGHIERFVVLGATFVTADFGHSYYAIPTDKFSAQSKSLHLVKFRH